ncbi:MAG: shikimate dehydrogenase [Pseudomonadota bacterium]
MSGPEFLTAGVMGWPIGHSLSPRLHGHWLQRYGIAGAYVPMAVPPDRVGEAIRGVVALGLKGCNVTVPHKEAVMPFLDDVAPAAKRIGAVNTIVVAEGGATRGTNTDGFGFLENIKAGAPGWQPDSGPALVIGAGGAARSILVALADEGCPEIRLANRTKERTDRVVHELGSPLQAISWDERSDAVNGAALVVNTSTAGMEGQAELDLALDELGPEAVVTDIVYVPLQTKLLAEASARGNRTVDGLGMLLHQARPGFEAWFGVAPVVDEALRNAVLAPR